MSLLSYLSSNPKQIDDVNTQSLLVTKVGADENEESDIEELKKQCAFYKSKAANAELQLKHAKNALRKAASLSLEKDIIIQDLKNKLKKKTKAKDDLMSEESNSNCLSNAYDSKFEFSDLKIIRSVRKGPENDSNFVLNIARALYRDDFSKLKNRTATGRSKDSSKEAVTPLKKDIIESMFKKRIEDEGNQNLEIRLKSVNKHLRSAIFNIIKAESKNNDAPQSPSASNLQPVTSTHFNTRPSMTPAGGMEPQIPTTNDTALDAISTLDHGVQYNVSSGQYAVPYTNDNLYPQYESWPRQSSSQENNPLCYFSQFQGNL